MPIKYSLARASIKNGDMLGCGCKHIVAQVIQQATGYAESHPEIAVWVRIGSGRARLCSFGSLGEAGGVRLTPVSQLLKKYHRLGGRIWVHPLLDPTRGDRIVYEAEKLWVAGTGYPSLIQHVLTLCPWLRWLLRRFRKSADLDPEAVHCAEYVATVLANSGWDWGDEPVTLTPGEVLRKCAWYRRPPMELELG